MSVIPVQRAETFYLPPPHLAPTAWDLVPVAERVLRWYEIRQHRRLAVPAGVLLGQSRYARINHSRWVADCPCGSAQVVSPADPRMACPECGAGWLTVTFPTDPDAAEAAVADLLPSERNWWNPDDPDPWGRPTTPVPPADGQEPDA